MSFGVYLLVHINVEKTYLGTIQIIITHGYDDDSNDSDDNDDEILPIPIYVPPQGQVFLGHVKNLNVERKQKQNKT